MKKKDTRVIFYSLTTIIKVFSFLNHREKLMAISKLETCKKQLPTYPNNGQCQNANPADRHVDPGR